MATEAGRVPALAPHTGVSTWSRIYGLGSVYAKTLRDSRLSFLIVAGLLGGIMLVVGAGIGNIYPTLASRQDMAKLVADIPPIMSGLTGKALHIDTIGGYMTWKYGPYFAVIAGVWSILALSGSLATEARRGSLDMVAAAPLGKSRLAFEKLAAHLTAMAGVILVMAFASWLVGAAFGKFPGDAIPPQAAIGYALWLGLVSLACGSVAWALAPFIGRASAAGIAGVVLLGGYMLNGYQASFPSLSGVANLTWFGWTTNHNPLEGQYDWISLIPVALVALILFGVGIVAFERRDLGATSPLPTPSLPASVLGLHGPVGRAFGERLPLSLAWGIGIGVFGLVIAAVAPSLASAFASMDQSTAQIFKNAFPNFDVTTAGGGLQLIFIQLGFIAAGYGAATLVAGWASDETGGRLEMLLATPLSRGFWLIRSGLGMFLAIAALNVVIAIAVGIGAVLAGSDALTPMAGSFTLGLYMVALAGIGIAVGGLFRTSIAADIVALVVTATFLLDLLVPALKLPNVVHELALTAHMGQPMVGLWDPAGMVACLVIGAIGLGLGAWGMGRRDVAR
jgi:ABC-2 type transport system permease protein